MPAPRTPKHPKAEKMLKASKDKADNEVTMLQGRIANLETELANETQKRDELAVELAAIEAL